MNISWLLTRVVLPVGIPLGALVLTAGAIALSPEANRQPPPPRVAQVEVAEVQPTAAVARVYGTGSVTAAKRVSLTTEVNGKVTYLADEMVPGGRFSKGDVLLRVDARDYKAALAAEQARLAQAELEVALEEKRGKIAEREWELFEDGRERTDLALRGPHLETARANLEAARAAVERAELNLSRTALRAPFDGVIAQENADLGQLVGPGTMVATLVGTDAAWVTVSVPVEQLRALAIPGVSAEEGSAGLVRQVLPDGSAIERKARVLRLIGELDPTTRTAQVLVEIPEPMSGDLPLLPGAYVEVELEGTPLPEAFVVPRVAVNDGDIVWVVGEGDVLERRQIGATWRDRESIVVATGLRAGDRVVTSPLSLPVEGMPVQTEAP
ncbi:MAG: efflux RND transporter periplasmic adaptor subunit [Deltaproteobacteria bacterium]|nr:MAG: efflux RND transporter periplasmic adaptor subunit [Deltaproteobacteria bacterium]